MCFGRARLSDFSPEFRAELEAIFADLATELETEPYEVVLDPDVQAVIFDGRRILVPRRFEAHWRRFRTVPTDLVRDAAYLAALRAAPLMDDADRQVMTEAFVRDRLLSHD